ncbi:MAG: tRNA (adenosine(37)-N6)-threonylcarbamoyltransferase complex ATPase subunit type 1 TsaE [Lentimicrobium sp.]|nr:tRNA (adenosine(37)-N6)-threonylcarbamoyltransferase complex ATPase subunit type 1 TsaE [Lentimicrobium sp.]
MSTHEFHCTDLLQLDEVASAIIRQYPNGRIFTLSGPMGAGKTTFIQAVCKVLQVKDIVNSPTFSIVNEYLTEEGKSVFHFDLYRLRKQEELMDIGYEDYFYSENICFVEWPEMAAELIPEDAVQISIRVNESDQTRMFLVNAPVIK